MSEILWNIIGVTWMGCIIMLVRRTNGDKIHPQVVTAYWIVFFVISLFPLSLAAHMGAAMDDVNDIGEVKTISGSRQKEYLELEAVLENQQDSSILQKEATKNGLAEICLMIWMAGFLLRAIIKILRTISIRKRIKEQCIGVHSCISVGKNKVNVWITEDIGPMVYGIKPAIYVPKEFSVGDIYHSILLHEKNHIIRKHHLLLLLMDIMSCVYWFLPYYEKIFLRALREDMETRCDYEVIKSKSVNPKEYTLHYAIVNGHQSGIKVSLNFSKEQVMRRVDRILNYRLNVKKSVCMSFILGILVMVCVLSVADFYLKPDRNGFTKWEIKQAKEEVVHMMDAVYQGDEQRVLRYIDKTGPLSDVTNFSDMQCDLCEIRYFPNTSNYYEKIYKEQYQLPEKEMIHLEGILKREGRKVIWGFTLVFDETDDTWKLYDWGQ